MLGWSVFSCLIGLIEVSKLKLLVLLKVPPATTQLIECLVFSLTNTLFWNTALTVSQMNLEDSDTTKELTNCWDESEFECFCVFSFYSFLLFPFFCIFVWFECQLALLALWWHTKQKGQEGVFCTVLSCWYNTFHFPIVTFISHFF